MLVTGSAGLIGSALTNALRVGGFEVVPFDLRDPHPRDVLDEAALAGAMAGCAGVVHLAAISRVVWGERDPDQCWRVNVDGLKHVLGAAQRAPAKPWVLFASSREVYGNTSAQSVTETAPVRPVNVYGRSKAQCERLVEAAHRELGLRTSVIRFSNVYGGTNDHADRVIPAFVRAAIDGEPLRVEGWESTFDFTHVDDVAAGVLNAVRLLEASEPRLPTLHVASGIGTTLGALAQKIVRLAASTSRVIRAPRHNFNVEHFVGDPAKSAELLGFRASIPLAEGLRRLIQETRRLHACRTLAGSRP